MTASRTPPARLPEGTYKLKPQAFFIEALRPTIRVEQAEIGYVVDGAHVNRPTIEKYYQFAHA